MVRLLGFAAAAFLLTSCATALEEPAQDLKIDIVGTGEALCDVTQPGRRYRAYAPGTIRVMKSNKPMNVKCMAPGNRELEVTLTPDMTPMMLANVATGIVPGVTWDYLTGASHYYPDLVVMDFSALPPKPYPLPDYQLVLEQNPSVAGMEQFRPGKSALISDVGQPGPQLNLREEPMASESVMVVEPAPATTTAPAAASSRPAGGQSYNPDLFDSPDK